MSDSIAGERERRTLEVLLISPLTKLDIILGKVIAAGAAGLIGALADSSGLLAYFALSGFRLGVTPALIVVWLLVSVGLILFTAFVSAIVASRSRSVRASQNVSFLITTLAMIVYFSALLVDYSRLPLFLRAILSLIPFTHGALALNYYAVGLLDYSIAYILLLYISSLLAAMVSSRAFDYERILV
jgi:ABC-2 type transport system permease protein